MGKSILLGTNNENKVKEITYLLVGYNYEIYTAKALNLLALEKTGLSFEENAKQKAKYYGIKSGILSLAEDSGLCIKALDGKPGVYTAKWLEEEGGIEKLFLRIKNELERAGVTAIKPEAVFKSAVALYDPVNESCHIANAEIKGYISGVFTGNNGFGYDPFFIPEGYSKTLAEMDFITKISLSPRTKAVKEILPQINR